MTVRLSLTALNLNDYDVIVFDLDDTLYSEKSYVESGYKAISHYIHALYQHDFFTAIQNNLSNDNVLLAALVEVGLPESLLPQLIQIYRYHWPEISLLPNAAKLLEKLKALDKKIYLITDGRSLTQRLKVNALNIQDYFQSVYISEEQGFEKPSLHSFEKITALEPNKRIVYIGDNPKKDFVAPKALKWSTIGVKHEAIRVHPMKVVQAPDVWVLTINELSIS